jgi:hypothetical protein
MTVSSTTARVSYSGNGTTTAFAVPFYFLASSHLLVVLRSSTGGEVTQVLGTNYTVTGAGVTSGGTVTMTVAPPSGSSLLISRNVPLTQETDFLPNDRLPADSLEQTVDKLTMITQQLDDSAERSLKFPDSVSTALSSTIPASSLRANRFLKFNASGEPAVADGPISNTISAEDYGAVGDNQNDDTGAMQAAMAAAVDTGKTLMLRAGATYLLSTWSAYTPPGILRIVGGAISGASGNSTLLGPATQVVCLSPSTNIAIENVVFDRWTSAISRTSSQTGSFDYFNVSGCRFVNCTGNGIVIQKPIDNYRIEDNDFEDCTGTSGSTAYGVLIGTNTYADQDTWQNGWIINNRFKNLSATGTRSLAAILVYGKAVTIANNKVDTLTQSGTGESWGIYTKVRFGQVYSNYVTGVSAAGSADNVGINIKGNTRSAPVSPQGYSNSVWGNHIKNITNPIAVAGIGTGLRVQTDDVVAYGNLVEECGIVCDESSAYRNVQIVNNIVQCAASTNIQGIRMEGTGTFVVADSNIIRNCVTGIFLTSPATMGSMSDAQVTRNFIAGAANGILWDAYSGATLTRTVIEHNVVKSATYGLIYNGSAGTVSDARIRFNDFDSCTSPVSGSVGTNPVIIGNLASNLTAPLLENITDLMVQRDATNSYGYSVTSNASKVLFNTNYGGAYFAFRVDGNVFDTLSIRGDNLGLGTDTFGTNAEKVVGIATGTAPSSGVADTIQIYSTDLSAGNTMLSLYTEGTPVGTGTPSANRTIAVRINGTVYYLLASTIP